MSFVVNIPTIFTKQTQVPNMYGNTILSGNEIIDGNLSVNGSLTLNGVNDANVAFESLDISSSLNVYGDTSLNDVNVSGIVTLSGQPRFMAFFSDVVDTSYDVTGIVPYNTIKYDIGNGYNTNVYTIPQDGLYLFTLSFISNGGGFIVDIEKNMATIQRSEDKVGSTSLGETIHMCVYTECLKNDIIRANVVSGSIRVAYDSSVSEQGYHQFTGFKVA